MEAGFIDDCAFRVQQKFKTVKARTLCVRLTPTTRAMAASSSSAGMNEMTVVGNSKNEQGVPTASFKHEHVWENIEGEAAGREPGTLQARPDGEGGSPRSTCVRWADVEDDDDMWGVSTTIPQKSEER